MRLKQADVLTLQLPHGVGDKVFFDEDLPGFGLRVRESGARTWLVQYDYGGRVRRLTLGSVAKMTLAQARKEARDKLARVQLGEDPAGDKAEDRIRLKETVGPLIEKYLAFRASDMRPRSLEETTRHLRQHAKPLHPLPIDDLDRRRVVALLDEVAEKSGPVAANRVRSSLMAFCVWCVGSGYVDANPVDYTPKRTESARRRLLSVDELRAIWRLLGEDAYSSIVKLLLLTGLRRTEIGDLTWDEVDVEGARIMLPAERTKAKRQHIVPLSDAALAVIQAQPHGDQLWVFGRGADRGFQDWSGSKTKLDAKLAAAGHELEGWSLHDIRRGLSTAMSEQLHVRPEVVEAILGHVIPGVRGIYNRAEYLDERRQELERWADLIVGASPKARVVRLPRR
jgi:integrase